MKQARRLLDIAQHLSEADDLRVICGDFNVDPKSDTLELLKATGMVELVTGRGFNTTRSLQYKKPGKFADYMLISDASAVVDFQVIYDLVVSDHCPLVLRL
jgi:endonuclease/exonuclease/phosphatase family metal-dependent hydrolase